MNRFLMGAVLILTIGNVVLRALAWKYVVDQVKRVPFKDVLSSYLIGIFTNLVFPFKFGDLAQGYILGQKDNINKVSMFSTVVMLRVFQSISLIIILLVFLTLSIDFPFKQRSTAIVILAAVILGASYFFAHTKYHLLSHVDTLVGRFSQKAAQKVHSFFILFIHGTTAVHNRAAVLSILVLTFCSWIIEIVMIKVTANAIDIPISLLVAGVILLTINFGLLFSPVPGNIGTYQFLCILAMSWFSISKTSALSFSIIYQLIQGIPIILGGIISSIQVTLQKGSSSDNNSK